MCTRLDVCMRASACMCALMYECMCTRMYACAHVCMHECIYAHMRARTHVCGCMCTHTCAGMYARAHVFGCASLRIRACVQRGTISGPPRPIPSPADGGPQSRSVAGDLTGPRGGWYRSRRSLAAPLSGMARRSSTPYVCTGGGAAPLSSRPRHRRTPVSVLPSCGDAHTACGAGCCPTRAHSVRDRAATALSLTHSPQTCRW